jgi:hypothetical protein|tara:strand:+ start:1007 stop:1663 length:657 start_codon:yes stop_codon:yes gene_type:complete
MVGQLLGAGMSIAGGLIGSGKRKAEMRAAQKEHDRRKSQYEQLDTSNVYANMENTMEDLTVNQQQAQFQAEQEQQGLSNTMGAMQGAAGGSGIAALAQSMAGMQSQNLRRASADIGRQESGNQMAAAQQAGNLQLYKAKGELISRDAEKDKVETLYGQAQGDLADKTAAVEAGKAKIMGGIGGIASGVLGGFGSGALGKGGGFGDWMSGADQGGKSRY